MTGRLIADPDTGRYLVVDPAGDVLDDTLGCGSTLEVQAGGQWVPTTLEMSAGEWYLAGTPYRGVLDNLAVRVPGDPM